MRVEGDEGGFALILVLWTLLLVAAIVQGLMLEVRASRSVASDEVTAFENDMVLDGAINRATVALLDDRDPLRLPLDGSTHAISLFGRDVELSEEAEAGKVDINLSPPDILSRLFRRLGSPDPEALAMALVAWREPTPALQRQDVIDRYRISGRGYGPRFGPFRSVGEVGLVIGMDDHLRRALQPFLTIWSGSGIVERSLASDGLLQILAEDGDRLAESQRRARNSDQAAGWKQSVALGDVITITARLSSPTTRRARAATIQVVSGTPISFRVIAWQ